MGTHNLLKTENGWTCSVCKWQWKSKPLSKCPNVPRYDYWTQRKFIGRPTPANLMTQDELTELGEST